jgi:hypothetical protein
METTKKLHDPNLFHNGQYKYFPVVSCDILYPAFSVSQGCPRKVIIILQEIDYSEIDEQGIYDDARRQLEDRFPHCFIDAMEILKNSDLIY